MFLGGAHACCRTEAALTKSARTQSGKSRGAFTRKTFKQHRPTANSSGKSTLVLSFRPAAMSCEAIPRTNWACCCCCSQRGASAGAGEQEQPQLLDHARASITGVVVGPMLEMVDPSDDNSVSASRAYESRTLLSRVLSEVFRSLFAFLFYILIYIILLFKFLIHMNRA